MAYSITIKIMPLSATKITYHKRPLIAPPRILAPTPPPPPVIGQSTSKLTIHPLISPPLSCIEMKSIFYNVLKL